MGRGLAIVSAGLVVSHFDLPSVDAATTTQATATSPDTTSAVARATNDAIARLYREVRREPVFRDIDAGAIIDALDAQADVLALIRSAQPVGAPRAISDDAVQVRLELNGRTLGDLLVSTAAAKPDRTPLAARRLQALTSNWDQKTFIAVGSSLGEFANDPTQSANGARNAARGAVGTFEPENARMRPVALPGTEGVMPSDQRIELEQSARRDAAERFIQQLERDPKSNELGLSHLLDNPANRQALIDQIASSQADVIDASQIALRVELEVDGGAVTREIENLMGSSAPAGLAEMVASHAPVAVGFARAPDTDARLSSFPAPVWAADPIGAEATSVAVGTALQTARAAERAARTALAEKILTLPVDDVHTIFDVMMEDEAIHLRLETLIQDAPLAGIDYEAKGQVRVRISLDGSRIWAALVAD